MNAYSRFTILLTGTDEEIQKGSEVISELISEVSGKYSFEGGKRIEIEENYDYVYTEDIAELAKEIVKADSDTKFSIEGVVDTSESAGEYMDFKIIYDGEKLTLAQSSWYLEVPMDMYDSYEDFCDEYDDGEDEPRVTEDEYEQLKEHYVVFALESGDGAFVTKVPLGEPMVIEVE